MKKLKALVLLFAFAVILVGGFTMTSPKVDAAKCCWVMVCTVNPPIICLEVCKKCPGL